MSATTPGGDRSILFLGTGNHSRSRLAEVIFNAVAQRMGLPWRASSRGLALEHGGSQVGPMSAPALATLKTMAISGGDAGTRMPLPVAAEDLERARRVIALSRTEHLPLLQERFPAWADRVEYWPIEDTPEGLTRIEREVMSLIARLLGGGERSEPPVTETSSAARGATRESVKKPPVVKVGRETAGRRGKGVTTVFDVPLDEQGLKELAATLKQRCGTGGTVKDGRIEIQGDQRERIIAELEKLGYKVKRVGG